MYILEHHKELVESIYIAKKGILPQKLYDQYKEKIKFLEEKWAQSMSKGGNHQGILIDITEFVQGEIESIKKSNFIVILDGLTDVGNIGAIVRSACALGVDGIVAIGIKQLNFSGIARTSVGALFDIPFAVMLNGLHFLNELKQIGFTLYGASMQGKSINEFNFTGKRALIMGSEGDGLSKRVLEKTDQLVSIPMKRDFDSLNVSVAAAIIIQRMSSDD